MKKKTPLLPPFFSVETRARLVLPSSPRSYINYDKKLVAAASVQRLINHLRYAARHELVRDNRNRPGIPLIYLIYLRSSTPINTWIRSRGSERVAFVS